MGSFKEGLVQLPTAISARLGERVKLEWKVCVCVCVCVLIIEVHHTEAQDGDYVVGLSVYVCVCV